MAMSGAKRPRGKFTSTAAAVVKAAVSPTVSAKPDVPVTPAKTSVPTRPVTAKLPAKAAIAQPVAAKAAAKPVTLPVTAPALTPEPAKVEPVAAVQAAISEAVSVAPAAVAPIADTIIETVKTVKEDMTMDAKTATIEATEKTKAMFADANDRTKGAMEKGTKFFQDVTEFSKGNVEAIVESSKIAAKGIESMGQDAAAYAKTSFESASEAMRTMASIKSPTEFMKFQADYVRSVFDGLVAHTSRGTEASLKLAGEVAQPISNRVAVAAEKIKVVA